MLTGEVMPDRRHRSSRPLRECVTAPRNSVVPVVLHSAHCDAGVCSPKDVLTCRESDARVAQDALSGVGGESTTQRWICDSFHLEPINSPSEHAAYQAPDLVVAEFLSSLDPGWRILPLQRV